MVGWLVCKGCLSSSFLREEAWNRRRVFRPDVVIRQMTPRYQKASISQSRKVFERFKLILEITSRHAEFSTYGWQDEMFQKTRMTFV